VTTVSGRPVELVPIHVGRRADGARFGVQFAPGIPRGGASTSAARRHPLTEVNWAELGIEPRWVGGLDASICAAAIDPGNQYGGGRQEWERLLAGARSRGETALALAFPGSVEGSRAMFPDTPDVGILLPGDAGTISGARLPQGTSIELAPGLLPVDKDLALRVRHLPDVEFRTLSRAGVSLPGPRGRGRFDPDGSFEPLLIDSLGDPVAAIWTPSAADQRWYVLPATAHLSRVIDWLVQKGLPQFVPNALVRARSHMADIPEWRTREETDAADALAEAEKTRAYLEEQFTQIRAQAALVRDGLLFGAGTQLENAVATVFEAAGFTVVRLDDKLGTRSADLLLTGFGLRLLVEVKSESGNAREDLVAPVRRHLDTWPQLCPGEPVDGAVLVVNHQRRQDPRARSTMVYARSEFVASLDTLVVGSVQLFHWWRVDDWESIRRAVGAKP
jgi:hypothetical protein